MRRFDWTWVMLGVVIAVIIALAIATEGGTCTGPDCNFMPDHSWP